MTSAKPTSAVQSVVNDLLADLHAKAGGERVGLTRESFAVVLLEVGSKHVGGASQSEARAFFLSLRVEELALARACAAGHNAAWELFLTRYREKLYLAALRIAREASAARELADTLYADLYGTGTRDGQVRALDADTGKALWQYQLDAALEGMPAVYEIAGREFVVFCAAAQAGLAPDTRTKIQGAYVAFALPK